MNGSPSTSFRRHPEQKTRQEIVSPLATFRLDYLFGKKSSAFLSFKRSFRFPVSDELIQFFPTFQVNPLIKPQTGNHYEVGVRHAFTDQIEANLTLFWVDLQDEIFFNPLTFTNENLPKTRRQGIEAGAKARPFPWLLLSGNYRYTRPFIRSVPFSGNDIPGVPRHKGSIGAELQLGRGFLLQCQGQFLSVPVVSSATLPIRLKDWVDITLSTETLLWLEGVEGICRRQ